MGRKRKTEAGDSSNRSHKKLGLWNPEDLEELSLQELHDLEKNLVTSLDNIRLVKENFILTVSDNDADMYKDQSQSVSSESFKPLHNEDVGDSLSSSSETADESYHSDKSSGQLGNLPSPQPHNGHSEVNVLETEVKSAHNEYTGYEEAPQGHRKRSKGMRTLASTNPPDVDGICGEHDFGPNEVNLAETEVNSASEEYVGNQETPQGHHKRSNTVRMFVDKNPPRSASMNEPSSPPSCFSAEPRSLGSRFSVEPPNIPPKCSSKLPRFHRMRTRHMQHRLGRFTNTKDSPLIIKD